MDLELVDVLMLSAILITFAGVVTSFVMTVVTRKNMLKVELYLLTLGVASSIFSLVIFMALPEVAYKWMVSCAVLQCFGIAIVRNRSQEAKYYLFALGAASVVLLVAIAISTGLFLAWVLVVGGLLWCTIAVLALSKDRRRLNHPVGFIQVIGYALLLWFSFFLAVVVFNAIGMVLVLMVA